MKLLKCKRQLGPVDRLLYEIGIVALCIIVASVLLYCCTGISVLNIKYPCIFNKLTDLPCPGCGGTRAMRAILRGDILLGLYYYPPLPFALIVYVVFMLRCFCYKYFGTSKSKDGAVIKYVYIFVVLMIIQWIAKIISQKCFGYYWLLNNPFIKH